MTNQNDINSGIDWGELLPQLYSYTHQLLKQKQWFRGGDTDTFTKGKKVDDYVFEAIGKYLENPEKYDPEKRSLVNYLKQHIIRTLVWNDAQSQENITSKDIFSIADTIEEDDNGSYIDSVLPYAEAYFDQELDFETIMKEIELEISKDKIAEEIYLGERCYGLKRSEIIEEFSISERDFDSGKKRMKTILNNIAKKYNIKKQTV